MSYTVKVRGRSESDFRGARPVSIEPLLEKPGRNEKSLIYKVVTAQVELCKQNADIEGAWEAIKKYRDADFGGYQAPLNVFQKDNQNGGCPYIGGHAVFGGLRDAAGWLFPQFFYEKVPGKTKRPSKTHFRKFVIVRPNHIFFYRNGEKIIKAHGVEDQQPTPAVKGFARYEVIHHPFDFSFTISINDNGLFAKLLKDKKKVKDIIYQGANHGLGACRSAGYGQWEITNYEVG